MKLLKVRNPLLATNYQGCLCKNPSTTLSPAPMFFDKVFVVAQFLFSDSPKNLWRMIKMEDFESDSALVPEQRFGPLKIRVASSLLTRGI